MAYAEKASERVSVVGLVLPIATFSATAYKTDAIDMSKYRRFLFIVPVGVIGSSATVDFNVAWSATSGGTYASLGTGAAIVQDTAGSDWHLIEVATEFVYNAHPTAGWLKGQLTIGTANTPCAVVALGFDPRLKPVTQDAAAIGQTLATTFAQ